MAIKANVEFQAETRKATGTGAARQTRREGKVPVAVYASGKPNLHLAVSAKELGQHYFKGGFMNKVVSLKVDGNDHFAIPRDIQLDPVSDKIEHADFLTVDETSVVKVLVPIHYNNADRALGIKRGGALNIVRHEVELFAPVTNIPSTIEIDITNLNIGDSIHIDSVELPEGVTPVIRGRDFTLASIAGRRKEEEEAAPTAAPSAGAVPASTAKAPAEGDAKAPAKPAAKK